MKNMLMLSVACFILMINYYLVPQQRDQIVTAMATATQPIQSQTVPVPTISNPQTKSRLTSEEEKCIEAFAYEFSNSIELQKQAADSPFSKKTARTLMAAERCAGQGR